MIRLTGIQETRSTVHALRSAPGSTLGLVPTMGALHEGHLSLVREARHACDHVAVSIFVNPTQFAPGEDLDRYPRDLDRDAALLEAEGVDLLFAPVPKEIYPAGETGVTVDPGPLGSRLDGLSRPGHFRGVATIVTKLLHIIQPDRAFFGQKDAAQVAVLRALVHDLNFRVEVVVLPTVRDADGLALSSRNRFLTPAERRAALALPGALACARRALEAGDRDATAVLARMRSHLTSPEIRIDYVEAVDAGTLLSQDMISADTLLAVAAWVGQTRLIDNLLVRDLDLPASEHLA